MIPNKKPKLFGVVSAKWYPLLTDNVGEAPTYGPAIDLPGIQAISVGDNSQEIEGRGDERIMEVEYVDDKSDIGFDLLYAPFDLMASINGGVVADGADDSTYHGPGPDDIGNYGKIEAVTKPRKEKLIIHKCRGRLFFAGLTGGQFNNCSFKGTAVHTTGNVHDGKPRRFSLKQSSAAMTLGGISQVVSLAVAGAVTTAGNATVVVTTAGMTGSPKTKSVAVALNDSAAVVAQKVREALAADTAVNAIWTIGGAGTVVTLTRTTPAANDATALVTIADGTSVGITSASSTITVAGVAVS